MDTTDYWYHYSELGFDICVKECPSIALNSLQDLEDLYDQGTKMCRYDLPKSAYAFDSGEFCAEENSPATTTFILDCTSRYNPQTGQIGLVKDFTQKLAADIYSMRRLIGVATLLSVVVCYLWLLILRYVASVCVYSILAGMVLGSIGSSGFMWLAYKDKIYVKEAVNNKDLWLFGSIAVTLAAVIICFIILAMLKRVRLAITIFGEASKFVTRVPLITCQPLMSIVYFLVVGSALFVLTFALLSPTEPNVQDNGTNVTFEQGPLYYFAIGSAFMIFWIYQISHDSTEFVIASSVAQWYFTTEDETLSSPILTAIGYLVRYQLGSIAFGSLLIAMIKFIRAILYYICSKLDQAKMNFVKSLLNVVQCCLACFEKTLKFITRNAYIEMAISGRGFIVSAKKSFSFMIRNALSLATINVITFVLLWMSKLLLAGGVAAGAFYYQKTKFAPTDYNFNFTAALVTGLATFVIAHIFLEVYDMSIDAIFYCFCKDKEMNKGSDKNYYMSKDLAKLVHSKKKSIRSKSS